MNISTFHAIAHKLNKLGIPIFPSIIYYIQFFLFNSSVPCTTKIGKDTRFGYGGIGVVVHAHAVIGERCVIGKGSTIGGGLRCKAPVIGNHVYIASGAVILGDITIGDNVIIGANSVVLRDIPSNCVAAGIPAKVIKKDIDIGEIEDF